jgi:hypothetical protein
MSQKRSAAFSMAKRFLMENGNLINCYSIHPLARFAVAVRFVTSDEIARAVAEGEEWETAAPAADGSG